jgi:hypothetical protein
MVVLYLFSFLLLFSSSNIKKGMYVTATDNVSPLVANCPVNKLAYGQAFELLPMPGGGYLLSF